VKVEAQFDFDMFVRMSVLILFMQYNYPKTKAFVFVAFLYSVLKLHSPCKLQRVSV